MNDLTGVKNWEMAPSQYYDWTLLTVLLEDRWLFLYEDTNL